MAALPNELNSLQSSLGKHVFLSPHADEIAEAELTWSRLQAVPKPTLFPWYYTVLK